MTPFDELDPFGPSIRIPELRDIRMTGRFREVLDEPALQRLRRVRQLGPTHLVYPGAMHTRFEHSLGAFGYAQRFLRSLLRTPAFADSVDEQDLLTLLAAVLVHDVGHYPFAHNLEALHRRGRDTPRHEDLAATMLAGPLGAALKRSVGVDPERVGRLVQLKHSDQPTPTDQVLASILSSAIDADKMDYLERDSSHLGVPYGRSFDAARLIAALTLNATESSIAITAKGKIPAEMFVFSRYMMFSEAYWHHTVRAASAMVEAAMGDFMARAAPESAALTEQLLRCSDDVLLEYLRDTAGPDGVCYQLLSGLTGDRRRLHKRVCTYSRAYAEPEKRAAYERLYGLDGAGLDATTARLREAVARITGRPVGPADVLIDTPPRDKDHPEHVEVLYQGMHGRRSYPLHEMSRIVAGVHGDFVHVVKKIRVFVAPELAMACRARQSETEDAFIAAIMASPDSPDSAGAAARRETST